MLVPAAGLEPARPIRPRDFKSPVSTIPPRRLNIITLILLVNLIDTAPQTTPNCLPYVYEAETRDYEQPTNKDNSANHYQH